MEKYLFTVTLDPQHLVAVTHISSLIRAWYRSTYDDLISLLSSSFQLSLVQSGPGPIPIETFDIRYRCSGANISAGENVLDSDFHSAT